MIARRELDRRQLVVAMTDGHDNLSVLQAPMLLQVAARSEAALHVVLVGSNSGSHTAPPPSLLFQDFNEAALHEATARTGGELHSGALSDTPVEAFRKILDDYRQSYILHYTPSGVPRTGWHDLTVTLKRPGKFTIRARKGYDGGS